MCRASAGGRIKCCIEIQHRCSSFCIASSSSSFFFYWQTIKILICAPFFHLSVRMLHIIHCSHSNTAKGRGKSRIRNSRGEEKSETIKTWWNIGNETISKCRWNGTIFARQEHNNKQKHEIREYVLVKAFIFQASSRRMNDGIEKKNIMLNLTHVDVVHYELNIGAHTDRE